MKNQGTARENIIAKSYTDHFGRILGYISRRVNDIYEAENLTQDVWARLLESNAEIEETSLLSLLYTIARNLVNDYLRHLYRTLGAVENLTPANYDDYTATDVESEIIAHDLARKEERYVECLPKQRRIIYVMSRYEDKSVDDIAGELSLSFRTVENHLRLGRKDVRGYISAIA